MNCTIRPVRQADAEASNKAVNSVICEKRYLLTANILSLAATSDFIAQTTSNKYAHYVADAHNKIVGWVDVTPKQHQALQHAGQLGMTVAAEYRGQGIGKALLKCAVEYAYKTGLKRLELEVFAGNFAAIALYEQYGFSHADTKRNDVYVDGACKDTCAMAQCRI